MDPRTNEITDPPSHNPPFKTMICGAWLWFHNQFYNLQRITQLIQFMAKPIHPRIRNHPVRPHKSGAGGQLQSICSVGIGGGGIWGSRDISKCFVLSPSIWVSRSTVLINSRGLFVYILPSDKFSHVIRVFGNRMAEKLPQRLLSGSSLDYKFNWNYNYFAAHPETISTCRHCINKAHHCSMVAGGCVAAEVAKVAFSGLCQTLNNLFEVLWLCNLVSLQYSGY